MYHSDGAKYVGTNFILMNVNLVKIISKYGIVVEENTWNIIGTFIGRSYFSQELKLT